MQPAPLTRNENARLAALHSAAILDTPPEDEFDQVVALAAEICNTSMATITLIDKNRQWFKARKGLDVQETHRDTSLDSRFADNPFVVGEPYVKFYAGVPLCLSDGHAVGALCVMDKLPRDLSDQEERALRVLAQHVTNLIELRRARNDTHRLLRELRERSITHERVSHTATRLLTVVAHDVRGPLAAIIGVLEFDDFELAPLRDEIRAQAVLARDLLDQILAWARTMMRGGPTVEYNVDVNHIVNDVIAGASISAAHKNLTISADIQVSTLDTDPNLLRFILNSLVTNAIKFTDNGSIDVRMVRDRTGNTILEVADTGVGMSPNTLNGLFDWGRRSINAGTSNEKGAGLALLLVNDFLNLMGCTIRIESQIDKGTRVFVTCPEVAVGTSL